MVFIKSCPQFILESRCLQSVFHLVCFFISAPIYLSIIYILIGNRKQPTLSSPFFKIFLHLGFADILRFFALNFGLQAIVLWMTNAQCFGCLLLAANRLTLYYYTLQHELIWLGNRTSKAIGLIVWFIPFCMALPLLVLRSQYNVNLEGNSTVLFTSPIHAAIFSASFTSTRIIGGICLALCYSFLFWKVREKSKQTALLRDNRWTANVDRKADMMGLKLVLCGFFVSIWLIIHGFTIMYNVINKIYFGSLDERGQFISGFIGDVFTGINPFMLLLFNFKVREKFWNLLCCK